MFVQRRELAGDCIGQGAGHAPDLEVGERRTALDPEVVDEERGVAVWLRPLVEPGDRVRGGAAEHEVDRHEERARQTTRRPLDAPQG